MLMFLFVLLSVFSWCCQGKSPVNVAIGQAKWISSTCVHVPLTLTIKEGAHIYGPDTKKSVPTEIRASGHNIANVRVQWPTVNRGDSWTKRVPVRLEIDLSGRGKATLNVQVRGLACSHVCQTFSLESTHILHPKPNKNIWLEMILFAFLGGLILNIMPCVLPVIGLKMKSFVQTDPRRFRAMCRNTIMGIMSGFWAMALGMIVVTKVMGVAAGWGTHLLQSSFFAAVMTMVMMGGAYMLWGVFHLNPPQWVARAMTQDRTHGVTDFVSGFLAVLLATPCSAPFLGASIGFALAGSAMEIMVFYTVIGLGFAMPYVLAMLIDPAKIMPKPGAWMNRVSKVMAVLFLASSAWLAWIVDGFLQGAWSGVMWTAWGAMSVWPLVHSGVGRMSFSGVMRFFPILMGCIFMMVPVVQHRVHHAPVSLRDGAIQWEELTDARFQKALNDGRIIYVDITGRGCALCMVNKRIYRHPVIQQLMTDAQVVCLRGDFGANPDIILPFLKRYGRSAIPFNMMVHASHPDGYILPEILTVASIQQNMEKIKASMASP